MLTFIETLSLLHVKTRFRDESGRLLVKEGDMIAWKTLGGDRYQGVIEELDSNVAYVRVGDGIKTVEC